MTVPMEQVGRAGRPGGTGVARRAVWVGEFAP